MAMVKGCSFALIASIAIAGCSGGGGGPGPTSTVTPPPIVTRSYTFPAGDATASAGATAWDIVGVTTTLSGQFGNAGGDSYDTLRVDVTFAQNVANALPAPGQMLTSGNQLGVSIALDTDANLMTGSFAACRMPSTQFPFEYVTDQGNDPSRLADGNYSILGGNGPISSGGRNPPAEAMVSASAHVLSETFYLTALGVHNGSSAPRIGVAVAAGNGTGMSNADIGNTDCVPTLPAIEIVTV